MDSGFSQRAGFSRHFGTAATFPSFVGLRMGQEEQGLPLLGAGTQVLSCWDVTAVSLPWGCDTGTVPWGCVP